MLRFSSRIDPEFFLNIDESEPETPETAAECLPGKLRTRRARYNLSGRNIGRVKKTRLDFS
jgi:hypothetical protein